MMKMRLNLLHGQSLDNSAASLIDKLDFIWIDETENKKHNIEYERTTRKPYKLDEL